MAFQQSVNDLEALELVKRSLLQKKDLISHLQQEVDTWKQMYCSLEEEVQFLRKQFNEQQSCSNTSDDIYAFGTHFVENPRSSEVEVKEEAYEDEESLEDEGASGHVQVGIKRRGSDCNDLGENVKKSCLDLEDQTPEETAELIPSLCSDALVETAGPIIAVEDMGSPGQQKQQRTDQASRGRAITKVSVKVEHPESREDPPARGAPQRTDQTSRGRASTEVSENVEHLESREDPPARGEPQATDYMVGNCSASNVGHLRALKDPDGDRPLQHTYSKCGSAFVNRLDLDGHVCNQTENVLSSCPLEGCGFRTRYLRSMKQHMRTHTGEKPFECTVEGCGYRSAQSSGMTKHMRTHTGEKPFACRVEGCEYRCCQSSVLKRHELTHTGEKPFACTVEGCEYRCAQLHYMKTHKRTHTGEKPFACTVEGCGYRCAQLHYMKTHERTHTGEKPFACPVEGCEYRCCQSSMLKRHELTHTGEKPFACAVEGCLYRSSRSSLMKNHMRTHNGE